MTLFPYTTLFRAVASIPSELFRERVFGCFIDDVHGLDCLDLIGVDNVMIETDYPHTDSTWPNSIANAHKRLAGRSDDDIYKILQGNAMRVFDFQPAPIPVRAEGPNGKELRWQPR